MKATFLLKADQNWVGVVDDKLLIKGPLPIIFLQSWGKAPNVTASVTCCNLPILNDTGGESFPSTHPEILDISSIFYCQTATGKLQISSWGGLPC